MKARDPVPAKSTHDLGREGGWEWVWLLKASLGPKKRLRALVWSEMKGGGVGVREWTRTGGKARTRAGGGAKTRGSSGMTHCFCGQQCADSGSPA